MGFLGLCKNDPLVTTLRDTFDANVVRVPEERIKPLAVLAARDGKTAYEGALADILPGAPPEQLVGVKPATGAMANVSGKKSTKVDTALGLKILEGFLSGFGIPPAGITAKFKGTKEVSFTFGKVARSYVDPTLIGQALNGRGLDRGNPLAAIFFGDDPWHLIVVDSVITSSDFTINVEKANSEDFSIDVPAIQNLVGEVQANVKVESASSTQITFEGPQSLTFAFSALRLFLDSDGRITRMPPESGLFMTDGNARPLEDSYRWVVGEPAMVEIEQDAAEAVRAVVGGG